MKALLIVEIIPPPCQTLYQAYVILPVTLNPKSQEVKAILKWPIARSCVSYKSGNEKYIQLCSYPVSDQAPLPEDNGVMGLFWKIGQSWHM